MLGNFSTRYPKALKATIDRCNRQFINSIEVLAAYTGAIRYASYLQQGFAVHGRAMSLPQMMSAARWSNAFVEITLSNRRNPLNRKVITLDPLTVVDPVVFDISQVRLEALLREEVYSHDEGDPNNNDRPNDEGDDRNNDNNLDGSEDDNDDDDDDDDDADNEAGGDDDEAEGNEADEGENSTNDPKEELTAGRANRETVHTAADGKVCDPSLGSFTTWQPSNHTNPESSLGWAIMSLPKVLTAPGRRPKMDCLSLEFLCLAAESRGYDISIRACAKPASAESPHKT